MNDDGDDDEAKQYDDGNDDCDCDDKLTVAGRLPAAPLVIPVQPAAVGVCMHVSVEKLGLSLLGFLTLVGCKINCFVLHLFHSYQC